MAGPLKGIRIIEFAGIGPGPYCGMMLADHGAEVIRIDRPGGFMDPRDPLSRNRTSIALDMKNPDAVAIARDLCKSADGIIEGYRPGVMERLGLGPDVLLADNPRLVYGRMTGWGQYGPYSQAAGHDINYIALSGVLHTVGRAGEKPVPPVNYVGDFGGGGMMLAFGMASALLHAAKTGEGQVIDCAMTDGSALLAGMSWGFYAMGRLRDEPGVNMLDTGAHFYDPYACADGKFISVGPLEPQFFAELVRLLDLGDRCPGQMEFDRFDEMRALFAETFKQRTQAEWVELFEGTDACVAGIIPMSEAKDHPHMAARQVFVEKDGVVQPQPAPRFSRTPATLGLPPSAKAGIHTREALAAWGVEDVDGLIERGAAVQA